MVLGEEGEEEGKRGKLTVFSHRLSKRWADAKDDARKDILEAGDEEKGCVFGIFNVGFLLFDFGGNEPGW